MDTTKYIAHIALFRGVDAVSAGRLLQNSLVQFKTYRKNAMVAFEGQNCAHIGVIAEGLVEAQNIAPSGTVTSVARFAEGQTFGEALLFSERSIYPVSLEAVQKSKIIFIPKNDLIIWMKKESKIMENYLAVLSNRLLLLNSRIKILSLKTIRQKLAYFILAEYKKQKSMTIVLPVSQRELSESMAVERPSVSRELQNMARASLIERSNKRISILDMAGLEKLMGGTDE